MDRIAALRSVLEADPSNTFARYGLAQECVKSGENEQALTEFNNILESNPDYQAAYYHAGKALERLGRKEDAQAMYKAGIEASQRTGDDHARSELEVAIQEL